MSPEERAARPGDPEAVHVLLPNMSYACGGNILTKAGRSNCGTWRWETVTCPECRAPGREYLSAVVQWMQGHSEHPDDVAPEPPEHRPLVASAEVALW